MSLCRHFGFFRKGLAYLKAGPSPEAHPFRAQTIIPMKRIVPFTFFLLLSLGYGQAQSFSYHVLTVKGLVTSKNLGRIFQTGDLVPATDELTFKGPDDMVGLVRSDGKRYILKNKDGKKNAGVPFQEALMLGKTRIEWKNFTLKTMSDLREYFTDDPYIFLDSIAKIRIDRKTFPQNSAQFFYFRFLWKGPKGEEDVDKKLEYRGDTLILRQASIFKVDNRPIQQKDVRDYTLNYFNKGEIDRIGSFKVIFPDQEKLKLEVGLLVEKMKENGYKPLHMQGATEAYIRQFYGSIDRINLIYWLRKHFGVPEK